MLYRKAGKSSTSVNPSTDYPPIPRLAQTTNATLSVHDPSLIGIAGINLRHFFQMDPLEESPWGDSAATSQSAQAPATSSNEPTSQDDRSSSAPASSTRPTRTAPRRLVAQPTRLEAVDDDDPLGPLGPLGGSTSDDSPEPSQDAPPAPPQKEDIVIRTTMPPQQARRMDPADPHRIDDDDDQFDLPTGPRVPPPVQPAQPSPVRSTTSPSVSVEQASRPTFHITVGDPHKVGDFTSSHVQYAVRTKVRANAPCLWFCGGGRDTIVANVSPQSPLPLDNIKSIQGIRV